MSQTPAVDAKEIMSETKSITLLNSEINKELADPSIVRALLATTFKGFDEKLMRQAVFEGVVRGFPFKSFLQKDVYAIKYGQTYNLVTSVDYARKLGMRSGVIGKSKPEFGMIGENIESCSVTIKRKVGDEIGEFTSLVYFDEYTTNQNLWKTKPRTMIAKVAEMHALRMACPEEMAKVYTSEEFDKENASEGSYKVIRTQDSYEQEEKPNMLLHQNKRGEVEEEVTVTGGDDVQEIPEDNTSRLNLLMAKAMKKWPDATESQRLKKIKDFTGLGVEASNYLTIIKMIS